MIVLIKHSPLCKRVHIRRIVFIIKLNKWINTRTYILTNGVYISFIEDFKHDIEYLIKNEVSILWNIISSSENCDEIYKYVKENNIKINAEGFINELIQKKILQSDKTWEITKTNYLNVYISKKDKNYKYYNDFRSVFFQKNGFLNTLYLNLNYKCNLKCKHCCNPKDENQSAINFETAKKIIDEAYELGVYSVLISGGECTLNKDFLKIARYIKHKHLDLTIKTNAQKIYDDENLFDKIVDLYPNSIDISIYSMKPQIHDYITGVKGSLKKSIDVIKRLKLKNIKVGIVHLMLSLNKDEHPAVEKYAKKYGVSFVEDYRFINNKKNKNLFCKLNKKFIKDIYLNKLNITKPREKFEKSNKIICQAGFDRLAIEPDLDILPCFYFYFPLGNFKENSLKEIKEKIVPEFRKNFIVSNLKECFKYDYCEYCVYCPVASINDRGFMKRSDTLCEDAKAYKKALMQKNN